MANLRLAFQTLKKTPFITAVAVQEPDREQVFSYAMSPAARRR